MGLSNRGEKTWGRNDRLPSHKRTQLKFSRKLFLKTGFATFQGRSSNISLLHYLSIHDLQLCV